MSPRAVPATAVSVGIAPLLVLARRGAIHSVFARALNLELGGCLVTVAHERAGRLPNGITVAGAPDFLTLGLGPGDRVDIDREAIRSGGPGAIVELGQATAWDPTLPPAQGWTDPARRRRLLEPVPAGGLGTPHADPWGAWRHIDRLRGCTALGDLDGAESAAVALVGLGPGLTPSGDDLLVGCSAALRAAGHPLAAALSARIAAAARGRTTDVAQSFHDHAARGAYAERLRDVVLATDAAALTAAVARALAWGATSGADTLLGVLVGAQAVA